MTGCDIQISAVTVRAFDRKFPGRVPLADRGSAGNTPATEIIYNKMNMQREYRLNRNHKLQIYNAATLKMRTGHQLIQE